MYATSCGVEPEVDGHEDPPEAADAEERGEEAGRVVAHDRHPLARADAQRVEPGGLGARPARPCGGT